MKPNIPYLILKPPIEYVKILAYTSPIAIFTYIKLWEMQDNKYEVCLNKDYIKGDHFFENKKIIHKYRKFRNDLLKICDQGLISFLEDPHFYHIDLVGWK